jgi:NTE family protein
LNPSHPTRTAFVLTGGGSLGAVQIGMLAELVAAGERPDFLVGVSAGAINGAFFAHDPSAANVARMGQIWSTVTTREALGFSWRSVLGLLGLRDHVANPAGLRSLLRRELRCQSFEQTTVPLHVVCAELVTGDEVVISNGEIIEAVLASAAIPGVFPPVVIGAHTLVDGAVAAVSPIATALRLGANRVIVLPCGFACAAKTVSRRALGRAMHAITLLSARQLRQDYERFAQQAMIHIVPPLCPLNWSSYDYSGGEQLIARARASTTEWIASGGLLQSAFPMPLTVHSHGARGEPVFS